MSDGMAGFAVGQRIITRGVDGRDYPAEVLDWDNDRIVSLPIHQLREFHEANRRTMLVRISGPPANIDGALCAVEPRTCRPAP